MNVFSAKDESGVIGCVIAIFIFLVCLQIYVKTNCFFKKLTKIFLADQIELIILMATFYMIGSMGCMWSWKFDIVKKQKKWYIRDAFERSATHCKAVGKLSRGVEMALKNIYYGKPLFQFRQVSQYNGLM